MPIEILLHDYQDEWGYEYVIGMGNLSGAAISKQIEDATGQEVLLRINSMGGSVYAGVQIVSAIKAHGNVNAQIDGIAFSAAAFISAACNNVKSSKYALYMIHNSRVYADMWGQFTAEDLRKLAEESSAQMDVCDKLMTEVLVEKSGLSVDEITKMLEDETWLTATEAKDFGFIDEITEASTQAIVKSMYDKAFAVAPMRIVAVAGKNLKTKENNMNGLAEEIKAQHNETKGLIAEIKAFFTGQKVVAQEPEKETETAVDDKPADAPVKKTEEELQSENEQLKADLAAANQKNEAADAALIEARNLTAETKALLAEVKSNYTPAEPVGNFQRNTAQQPTDRFSHLKNN